MVVSFPLYLETICIFVFLYFYLDITLIKCLKTWENLSANYHHGCQFAWYLETILRGGKNVNDLWCFQREFHKNKNMDSQCQFHAKYLHFQEGTNLNFDLWKAVITQIWEVKTSEAKESISPYMCNKSTSKTDVAPWCYEWIGMDGTPGGVRYRAAYGAKKQNHEKVCSPI